MRAIDIDEAYNIVINDIKPAFIIKINPQADEYIIDKIKSIIELSLDKYIHEGTVEYVDYWEQY